MSSFNTAAILELATSKLTSLEKDIGAFLEKRSTKDIWLAAGVGSVSLIGGYIYLKLKYPKKGDPSLVRPDRELLHDKFTPAKVPEDLDVIVIGSGMGSLSCAAILARLGLCIYLHVYYFIKLIHSMCVL